MGVVNKKINIFKEFTLQDWTYEFRGQEKKKRKLGIQEKQTPHITLQNYLQKKWTSP